MGYTPGNDYRQLLQDCEYKLARASYKSIIAQMFIDDWNYRVCSKHYEAENPLMLFITSRLQLCEQEIARRDKRQSVMTDDIPF